LKALAHESQEGGETIQRRLLDMHYCPIHPNHLMYVGLDSWTIMPKKIRKTQNSLHAYMILLKSAMNKGIDAFASLHKAYMEPT
jgi:hypothetical protein